ncbi:MAG: hypothetical protein A2Y17_10675 [Clostridiales bacterium GWF2_38_85]|nr:MAG: hypothetical protein A2Y17_10675 [Clostridiales bacterium GWF2_38_85]HBL83493.1 hypothetical protein [Clostridiales bacterium]
MSENYYYAVARTAEIETRLLDKSKIEQLISAPDALTALKMLSGTAYGEFTDRINNPAEFDKILNEQTKWLYQYIDEVCPQKEISELYLLQYDVFNLKVLFREKLLNREQPELYSTLGTVSLEELRSILIEDDYTKLMPEIAAAVKKIRESDGKSPQIIDNILDNSQFSAQLRLAKKSGSRFIENMIKTNIDLINIRDYLRTKNGQKAAFASVFIKGGNLSADFYYDTFIDGQPGLKEKLLSTDYTPVVKGVEEFEESGNLMLLEKLCDEYINYYVKSKNTATFGPEKLIGYITAKNNEISTLRMIFIGKVNYIAVKIIRQRLRDI